MTGDLLYKQLSFNEEYARKLVADLKEEEMTQIPAAGLINHPAWTLGHLISGRALLAEDLGAEFFIPVGWSELFLRKGPGDPRAPASNTELYPKKDELLRELHNQGEALKPLLLNLRPHQLEESFQWRFQSCFPSLGDMLLFMCANHEAMHLGQLAAWRRAMELPSALAQIK